MLENEINVEKCANVFSQGFLVASEGKSWGA